MNKCILAICIIAIMALCVDAQNDEGYFLSLEQKGQLIGSGQMSDIRGTRYDVRIVPGYKGPAKYGWRNIKEAGGDFGEYFKADKYKDIWDEGSDSIKWSFDDCFYDFTVKGTGKAWGKYFSRAKKRVDKRVFGWWLSYPWALMQSVVDNAVRIPVGLCGTVGGTAYGLALFPAYQMTEPTAVAVWDGGIQGSIMPLCGIAWNTVVAPPLALVGQKPIESRADGFWVKIVHQKEMGNEELDAMASFGKMLFEELKPYHPRRLAVDKEYEVEAGALHKRIKVLKDEVESLKRDNREGHKLIGEQENSHLTEMLSSQDGRALLETLVKLGWTETAIRRERAKIVRAISRQGVAKTDCLKIYHLLVRHAKMSVSSVGAYGTNKKTDPIREIGNVIEDME